MVPQIVDQFLTIKISFKFVQLFFFFFFELLCSNRSMTNVFSLHPNSCTRRPASSRFRWQPVGCCRTFCCCRHRRCCNRRPTSSRFRWQPLACCRTFSCCQNRRAPVRRRRYHHHHTVWSGWWRRYQRQQRCSSFRNVDSCLAVPQECSQRGCAFYSTLFYTFSFLHFLYLLFLRLKFFYHVPTAYFVTRPLTRIFTSIPFI